MISAHWAIAKDGSDLDKSSSGGVFGILARAILAEGGSVYGFAFKDGCASVACDRVTEAASLETLMRSKYVQGSISRETYRDIARDLAAGKPVLFSGTACQVAGLTRYLELKKVDPKNLISFDVVCHGVPSPRLWQDWLEYLSGELGVHIDGANFRDKATGWERYSVTYRAGSDAVLSHSSGDDWYMRAFLANASLRPSCFACWAKGSCGSDLTLGDYWGVRGVHPELAVDKGVSAVIVRTEKGASCIARCTEALRVGETSFDCIAEGNPCLIRSVKPHVRYGEFQDAIGTGDIRPLVERERFKPSLIARGRAVLKRLYAKVSSCWNRR